MQNENKTRSIGKKLPSSTKKKQVVFRRKAAPVRMCHWVAQDMTEVEGYTLDALQLWTRAQSHLELRIDLLLLEELRNMMQTSDNEISEYADGMTGELEFIALVKALQAYREICRKNYTGQ